MTVPSCAIHLAVLAWLQERTCECAMEGGRVQRVGLVQGWMEGQGKCQGGEGAGRSSGQKNVKSSARTSRKRQPFGRPLANLY